jgi:hypothetical protein
MNPVTPPDYTNGLSFFAWLWKSRKFMILAFLLNVFFGCAAYTGYLEYGKELPTLIASLFFGIGVPVVISVMNVREYLGKKRGIMR